MRINLETFTSLSQGSLLDAVHPCRITQNLFKLILNTYREIVQPPAGEVPSDESALYSWLKELSQTAVDALTSSEILRELDALNATALLSIDLRADVIFALLTHQQLDVTTTLQTTLRLVYVALLHQILMYHVAPATASPEGSRICKN